MDTVLNLLVYKQFKSHTDYGLFLHAVVRSHKGLAGCLMKPVIKRYLEFPRPQRIYFFGNFN